MDNSFIPMAQSVANQISDMIFLDKAYLPNGKLPSEHVLSTQLGVSRTSLREAIKMLVANGVLTVKRGSGTFVSSMSDWQKTALEFNYIENKRVLVESWYEFRLIYEPPCAKLAAERATDTEIEEIAASASRIVDLIGNGESFVEEDRYFHSLIMQAAKNDVISGILPLAENAIRNAIKFTSMMGFIELSAKNACTYHPAISKFISMRDGYGAEMAMRYHLKLGIEDYVRSVDL